MNQPALARRGPRSREQSTEGEEMCLKTQPAKTPVKFGLVTTTSLLAFYHNHSQTFIFLSLAN